MVGPLRQLYKTERFTIPATTGGRTLVRATDVFAWPADASDLPGTERDARAEEVVVHVFELVHDMVVNNIFGPPQMLDARWLTQEQIIVFAEQYRHALMPDGNETLFLIKLFGRHGEPRYHVAGVVLAVGGWLGATTHRIDSSYVWKPGSARVVIPERCH